MFSRHTLPFIQIGLAPPLPKCNPKSIGTMLTDNFKSVTFLFAIFLDERNLRWVSCQGQNSSLGAPAEAPFTQLTIFKPFKFYKSYFDF